MIRTPEIKLIHGDCIELLYSTPDKAYDLAIVDPEFGINIGESNRLVTDKGLPAKHWDKSTPDASYFRELFRVSKAQIIRGGNYFDLPPTKHPIIWDKQQPEDFSFGMFDFAWTSFAGPAKIFRYRVQTEKKKIHPTQKPVALYKWLLQNYAKPGDKILDTHGGSFSIAIACYDLGFDLTATELDPDYYRDGKARFERHKAQGQLFHVPQVAEAVQVKMF